ncbi:MAG: IS630 family transposase, partial [Phenylobacterium sp.]|nr:IS630 family transposase [Phenylobacterium sp.]MCA6232065.1 IS630 family transposase [Phenylobacterium sp.]MCA6249492.1 IS630 family transposase [Phenylobacterium sp.]MCA6263164.1 IS630 family transposase [Phenylobacterium sp.]MCA6265199.1 IS630 family transposase [Phenylobacterium sp.]
KALLRKAAARSIDQLWDAIARIIQTYSPHECANDFAAAGYDAD